MQQTIREILLIDDDADEQAFFQLALQEVAPEVKLIYAKTCSAALTELNNCEPDLIFLDLNMPSPGGFDCIKAVKSNARLCNIPVILYSGSGNPKDIERGGSAGAALYFEKCSTYGELVSALEEIFKTTQAIVPSQSYKVYKKGKFEPFGSKA